MTDGSGKSHPSLQNVTNVAFILGGGGILALLTGTWIPLALALGIAVIAGGSGIPPSGRVDPPPEGPLCDFCYQRPVEWAYPCRSFSIEYPPDIIAKIERDTGMRLPDALRGVNSEGAWAADQPCYTYIERNDWEALFERYWSYSPSGRALRFLGFTRTMAKTWTDALWSKFRENRLGPPQRVGPFG